MNPKRKRLYLILLVLCILATAGILLWGRATPAPVVTLPAATSSPSTTAAKARTINLDATYPTPTVFPQTQAIDGAILKSTDWTTLQDFNPATLDNSELGRENPFKNY